MPDSPQLFNSDQVQALLFAFEFGDLTREEHEVLMQAALLDSEVFCQLWEVTRNREFINQGAERQRLAALCYPAAKTSWVFRFPVYAWFGSAAALALFAVLSWNALRTHPGPDLKEASGANVSIELSNQLFEANLPASPGDAVTVADSGTTALSTSQVRFNLNIPAGTAVLVLRRLPGQAAEVLWPSMLAQSPVPEANERSLVFDLKNPTSMTSATVSEFRILLAPSGIDLRANLKALGDAKNQISAQSFSFPLVP